MNTRITGCALTVDLEDWFHGIISINNSIEKQQNLESRFVHSTQNFMEILSRANVKATFFILGSIAKKNPSLIREIYDEGHEISSHGWSHQLVYNMRPSEFKDDIQRSKDMLEDITQHKVLGYRAPYFSITKRSLWAIPIIDEVGYTYSSSIFPFHNFLYGIQGHPNAYYFHSKTLLEIPPKCLSILNFNIPWGGGLYFRVLPYFLFKHGFDAINAEKLGNLIYLHTSDFDLSQPQIKCTVLEKFIHFVGLKSLPKKVETFIKDYSPASIQQVFNQILCTETDLPV